MVKKPLKPTQKNLNGMNWAGDSIPEDQTDLRGTSGFHRRIMCSLSQFLGASNSQIK